MDKLSKGKVAAKLRGIIAFEMPIERLEGKFKMSQNREAEDAQGAANGVRAASGADADAVAAEIEKRMCRA